LKMGGFALTSQFACDVCDCSAIMLPDDLTDRSLVRCSGCGTSLGTWGDFKRQTRRIILEEVERGTVDPRGAGVDLALKL
jgi:hypothetical protein